jgi:hypothetical protein
VHVGLIDRLRDVAVEAGERDDRHGDAEQQPDVVHDDLEQLAEDDVLFVGFAVRSAWECFACVFTIRSRFSGAGGRRRPGGYQRVICRM